MDEMILQVRHLSKSFGKHEVLRDIDFTVNRGDVTSIIGASGSGKSTLPRGEHPHPEGRGRGLPDEGGYGLPVLQPL